ncbi:MAG: efflux RND transporter periplasmic adaptor subunit [Deltaproteobacteria bacterium]|nr:efflux RND transporter periplasmic adaptor subunit [Deltaproteobacteria bacterium]
MAVKLSWKFVALAAAFPIVLGGGLFALSHFEVIDFGLEDGDHSDHDDSTADEAMLHTCPMHPEVVQEGPGTCPICKMDLVPMKGSRAGAEKPEHDHAKHAKEPPVAAKSTTDGPLNGFDGMPAVGTKACCPVMQNEFTVHEGTESSEYLGKTYVYCCPGCKPTFEKDPEKHLEILAEHETPATATTKSPLNGFAGMPAVGTKAFCPVMQNEFTVNETTASSEYLGETYVYCCPGCKPMFEKEPEKYIEVLQKHAAGELPAPDQSTTSEEQSLQTGGSGKDVLIDPVVVQNMGVRVAPVEHGPIFRHVRTVGEVLVAEDHVSVVNLRFSGWIEHIFVDQTGQEVKKGQALFSVYSPELVAAQEEYLLAVRADGPESWLARSAARRLQLWGISKGLLKRVVKKGKSLRAITITAPRAGYVLHKNVLQGAHVNAGADLYRIGDLDRIWVNAEVYEYDAAWVNVGQPATMELSFQQGKTFEGAVAYVYPTLNPKTRTLTVRLEFENPGVNLKPGMLAIVRIETQRKDHVVTVPTEAVLHSGERRLVFVTKTYGRYEPREITIGLYGDNRRIEVLSGLVKGERVVTSGQFLLDSESQLQEAVQKLIDARLQAKSKGDYASDDAASSGGGSTYWTCGMCPQVVQDGPGQCPICGMDLVEKAR